MGVRALGSLLGLIGIGFGVYLVTRVIPEPIEVLATGSLPPGTTHLDLSNIPTYRAQWNFRLRVKSNLGKGVRLAARIEDPGPAEWRVKLLGSERFLLPGGEITPTLALFPSHNVGPFSGKVTLYTEDHDWSYTWTFSGEVVDIPHEGRRIVVNPSGFNLGDVKAGDVKEIHFTVSNDGDRAATVHSIEPRDPHRIQVTGIEPGQVVPPGRSVDVAARIKIPDTAGTHVFRLRVTSNAVNSKGVIELGVIARVVPDYACNPPSIDWGNVYRRKQPLLDLKMTGVKPFRVTQVFSDKLFKVVSLGGEELALNQTVSLRLRRDARMGPVKATIRLHIDPAGIETEVPIEMVVHPAVWAGSVNFGRVRPGGVVAKRKVPFYSMDALSFEITHATANLFAVERHNRAGMTPFLIVYPPKNLHVGIHRDKILVRTDHPDVPKLIIRVVIEIR